MKRIIYYFFIFVAIVSCKKDNFENDFDSVTIYYYGRSKQGTTYDVPIKFFKNGKEIAFFVLYSFDPKLESGVYNYNETLYSNFEPFQLYSYTDKTFYKGTSNWESKPITKGTITIQRNGEQYIFMTDVLTKDGYWHTKQFKGKVKKENYHQQSNIKGEFAVADIENCMATAYFSSRLPTDYSGGMSWLMMWSGDVLKGKEVKPHKFRIDVDVIAEDGRIIQGSFDGYDIWTDY